MHERLVREAPGGGSKIFFPLLFQTPFNSRNGMVQSKQQIYRKNVDSQQLIRSLYQLRWLLTIPCLWQFKKNNSLLNKAFPKQVQPCFTNYQPREDSFTIGCQGPWHLVLANFSTMGKVFKMINSLPYPSWQLVFDGCPGVSVVQENNGSIVPLVPDGASD